MKIDLSKINLNLLLALDVLLEERHVTRAGERLHISQSAMSNVLKQLRDLFEDELFVRGQASKMTPTAKAEALQPMIKAFVNQAELVFQELETFDPKKSDVTFTIGMSDYAEFVLLPRLTKHIEIHAPHVNIVVKQINYLKKADMFERDDVDISVGVYADIPEYLIATSLFSDVAVCVGWQQNPLFKKPITKEKFAKAPQVVVLYAEKLAELVSEQTVAEAGYKRRAAVVTQDVLGAIYALPQTNLICMVLESMAKVLIKSLPLTAKRPAFHCPKYDVSMVWHPKNRGSSAHQWLRNSIKIIAETYT